jgi:hypothetical protein
VPGFTSSDCRGCISGVTLNAGAGALTARGDSGELKGLWWIFRPCRMQDAVFNATNGIIPTTSILCVESTQHRIEGKESRGRNRARSHARGSRPIFGADRSPGEHARGRRNRARPRGARPRGARPRGARPRGARPRGARPRLAAVAESSTLPRRTARGRSSAVAARGPLPRPTPQAHAPGPRPRRTARGSRESSTLPRRTARGSRLAAVADLPQAHAPGIEHAPGSRLAADLPQAHGANTARRKRAERFYPVAALGLRRESEENLASKTCKLRSAA